MRVSAEDAWVECEQGDARILPPRDPAGTCGCLGDDFMVEGSDALLDRVDRVLKDARWWDVWVVVTSRKLSSSGGHCAGMSKRCASAGVRHTVRHRARRVAVTYIHSSGDEDMKSENKGNRWRRLLRLPYARLHGLINSSKNTIVRFSWPSIHFFATLCKQMHFGFPFGGVQRVLCTPQLHGRVKNFASVMHTRCITCGQRKVCFTEECLIVRCIVPELAPMRLL